MNDSNSINYVANARLDLHCLTNLGHAEWDNPVYNNKIDNDSKITTTITIMITITITAIIIRTIWIKTITIIRIIIRTIMTTNNDNNLINDLVKCYPDKNKDMNVDI